MANVPGMIVDLPVSRHHLFYVWCSVLAVLMDIINGFLIEKLDNDQKNGYIRFHKEHDIIKTTFLKVLTLLLLLDLSYSNYAVRIPPELLIGGYLLFTVALFIIIVRHDLSNHPKPIGTFADRIITIFIDPFRKKDRPLYRLNREKISLNWRGFLFPEFWFLWNEIYGLGMCLLYFYMVLYPNLPYWPIGSLSVWGTIRVVSGIFGSNIIRSKKSLHI